MYYGNYYDSLLNVLGPDSIESALTNINSPASRYQQAFCRYNRGDSTGVLNLLSNIPSEFDLNTAETDYHNYYEDFFGLLLNLQYNQTPFAQIDSTQKTVLYNIMDKNIWRRNRTFK